MNFFQAIWEWITSIFTKKEKYEREFFCGNFLIGYSGPFSLHFLSTRLDDNKRQVMIDAHKNYGCNFFKFNTLNPDSSCYITPYKSGFGGDFNEDWISMAKKWTNKLIDSGLTPCPCLTMDGSGSWTSPSNYNEHRRMVQKLSETFKDLWGNILIAHEGSEYWNSDYSQKFAGMVKEFFPDARVGIQSQEYAIYKACSNLDFLCYEFSWHPSAGNSHSAEEVWDIAKKVLDSCNGKQVIFDEFNTDAMGTKAKLQGLAVSAQDTLRCLGTDNGFPQDGNFIKFFRNLKPGMSASRSGNTVTMTGNGDSVLIDLNTGDYKKI